MGVISRVAVAVCVVVVGASGCAARPSAAAPTSGTGAVATPAATPTPRPSEVEPMRSPTRKPTKTPKPTADPGANDVIGPFGWQTLKLGMSADAADALGMLERTTEGGGELCAAWPALPITALDQAVVSEEHGVFAIHPKPVDWIHTPEGMHVGWTAAQVHATYPDFDPAHFDYPHGPTVRVPGNRNALYRMQFDSSRVLIKIILESRADVCSV